MNGESNFFLKVFIYFAEEKKTIINLIAVF
jgi:hypothetical protein